MARFPQLSGHIEGSEYPPGQLQSLLAQAASFASFAMLGASFAPALMPALGLPADRLPAPLLWLGENKLYGMVAYMTCNFIAQRLVATGAYEVFYDGELLYSALDRGGIVPSATFIANLLQRQGLIPAHEVGSF